MGDRERSGVDQVPFRMNSGELNMTTSVAFAPYAEISFTVCEYSSFPPFPSR